MTLGKECKIYQYKVNEKGIIEKNEINCRATEGIIFFNGNNIYKKDLGKWRVSYMYSFDSDLEKAAKSLIESLKEKIENNKKTIDLKMQANAKYENILKKLAENYNSN